MQTSSVRNILTIFLASPSDLSTERQLAREAVDDLNKYAGKYLGWQIEILGWEDTLPGQGRPQALINQEVAACDLFIGLLWKRWGQPTGEFSSGFEEEFTIARNRNAREGKPEIWLAFRQIDPDLLKDPGDHLKKVIQFKSDREASKDILFKEFINEADWSRLLRNWLHAYLFKLAGPLPQGVTTPLDIATSTSATISTSSLDDADTDAPIPHEHHEQVEKLFSIVSQCKDGYPLVQDSSGSNIISSFHIARLYLLSSTWFALIERRKLLETHAVSRLYESRELLDATSYENRLIIRTIFADKFDLVPGWYWFRELDSHEILRIMIHLLSDDQNEDIKLNILNLMSDAGLQLPLDQQQRQSALKTLLENSSERVKEAALSYLTKLGLPQDLEMLAELSNEYPKLRDHTLTARIAIQCRQQPDMGFALVIDEPDANVSKLLDQLRGYSGLFSNDVLEKGLRHAQAAVRRFSAKELFDRGDLSDASVEIMTNDTSAKVQELAYMHRIKRGLKVDLESLRKAAETKTPGKQGLLFTLFEETIDINKLTRLYFETLSSDNLKKELDWLSPHGHIAYEVLANKFFPTVADRIRKDLDDEFESLKNESIDSRAVQFGIENQLPGAPFKEALEELINKEKEALRKIKLREFGVAALSGLAAHGAKSDAAIGRKYLSFSDKADERLKEEAVRLLESFGDSSDVEMLVRIAKESAGSLRKAAVSAALKLSKATLSAAAEFISSDSAFLVQQGLTSLWLEDRAMALERTTERLGSENESVREAALLLIAKELTVPEMNLVLAAYLKRSEYYYNVVCWLDRLIYATPLKPAYQSRLEESVCTSSKSAA